MLPLRSPLLTLFLATTGAASALGTANDSILSLVPEDSYTLVYCEDFAAFRTRTESSDWRKLFSQRRSRLMLEGVFREQWSSSGPGLEETLAVAGELFGESVLFQTQSATGFLTTPPLDRSSLVEALDVWDSSSQAMDSALTEETSEGVILKHVERMVPRTPRTLEISGGTVEIRPPIRWTWECTESCNLEGEHSTDVRIGSGPYSALVNHPEVVGYFTSDSEEALLRVLEQSLSGIESDRESPLVAAFRRECSTRPHSTGVLTFTDFAPFFNDAEDELKDIAEDFVGDPTGLLGLEANTWLLTTSDVFAGSRIDCKGWLNIPRGTLAAKLADTFEPIASDFTAELPRELDMVWMLNWDIAECYRRARAALEERNGAESLRLLDEAASAAKAITKTDPIRDVLEQLEGHFALYSMQPPSKGRVDYGALLRIREGDAMMRAFENLSDSGSLLESEFDLSTIEDVDVYSMMDDYGEPLFGLAFLPRAMMIAESRVLPAALRAATGVKDAGMMSRSVYQGGFDRGQGSCFMALMSMGKMMSLLDLPMDAMEAPGEAGASSTSALFDSLLRFTVRRTETGFTFELAVD